MQQIVVSGIGGQGVLFVTKLLAETAVALGYSVLVSETHGMAQRGGNVISHLKVSPMGGPGGFTSPLVRPRQADIMIALHPDSMKAHGFFLKEDGVTFCNTAQGDGTFSIDAAAIAAELGSPVSMNLVVLGFSAASGKLFCGPQDLEATLRNLGGSRLALSLKAFEAGRSKALPLST